MHNNSIAILIAGALIATALVMGLMVDRYEAAGGATVNGIPAVWRLNVRTGIASLCMVASEPHPRSNDPVEQYRVQCN